MDEDHYGLGYQEAVEDLRNEVINRIDWSERDDGDESDLYPSERKQPVRIGWWRIKDLSAPAITIQVRKR